MSLHNDLATWAGKARRAGRDTITLDIKTAEAVAARKAEDRIGELLVKNDAKAAALARAEALLAEAREGLRPFAEAAAQVDDVPEEDHPAPDDMSIEGAIYEASQPTIGDLRRARALLAKLGEG